MGSRLRLFVRAIRYWWQRRTRGWDDSETWSLDHEIAKFTLPRLIRFKELNNGYPGSDGMETPEDWDNALDDMIYAMLYAKNQWDEEREWNHDMIKRGNELFGKYFNHLWW